MTLIEIFLLQREEFLIEIPLLKIPYHINMLVIFIVMKTPLNPPLNVGDRIICYHMEGETGISPGTKGTVVKISKDPFEYDSDEKIISVDWDNGSTLALITSTDAWKKISE
jgi:hypothetical protein